MQPTTDEPMPQDSRLKNFPISWFAAVMGLAGLTIVWTQAETVLQVPFAVSGYLSILTIAVFLVLAGTYATKFALFPDAVLAELKHPVKLSFFATISISLILISVAILKPAPSMSFWLWSLGTTLHLIVTLYVLSVWIHHTHFEIQHFNPAWFIPIVGNVLVPIAGMSHASPEISWFFFSIGLVFWIVLMTIFMYRVIFHHPLPDRMLPTLFILIAPPAVGCIAWVQLTGEIDALARILYYCGLFLTLLLLTQWRRFAKLSFYLSWWAYSFPLAAMTASTMLMLKGTGDSLFQPLAYATLVLITMLIGGLFIRTCLAVLRREICVEEG